VGIAEERREYAIRVLALDTQIDRVTMMNYPLAVNAARYWIDHAQFDDVSSRIEDAMEPLFDPAKPHFAMSLDMRY